MVSGSGTFAAAWIQIRPTRQTIQQQSKQEEKRLGKKFRVGENQRNGPLMGAGQDRPSMRLMPWTRRDAHGWCIVRHGFLYRSPPPPPPLLIVGYPRRSFRHAQRFVGTIKEWHTSQNNGFLNACTFLCTLIYLFIKIKKLNIIKLKLYLIEIYNNFNINYKKKYLLK